MKGDNAELVEMRQKSFPVRLHSFVAVVAVDEYQIDCFPPGLRRVAGFCTHDLDEICDACLAQVLIDDRKGVDGLRVIPARRGMRIDRKQLPAAVALQRESDRAGGLAAGGAYFHANPRLQRTRQAV